MLQLSGSHLQNQRSRMPKDIMLLKTNMIMSDYIHFQNVGFKKKLELTQTIFPRSWSHVYGHRSWMLKDDMLHNLCHNELLCPATGINST